MSINDIKNLGSFVWSLAELLRGDFKQSEYGKVSWRLLFPRSIRVATVHRADRMLGPLANAAVSRAVTHGY